MTYTTQQLQAMSDHTINHALYAKLYYSSNVDFPKFCPEYCNNHNDIMPLAFERFINMQHSGIDWITFKNDYQFIDKNPLRAIACLLLLMDE